MRLHRNCRFWPKSREVVGVAIAVLVDAQHNNMLWSENSRPHRHRWETSDVLNSIEQYK